MLKIEIVDRGSFDEVIHHGEVEVGDIYSNVCCEGYGWKVTVLMNSIWGICDNLNCPVEKDSHYRGVSHKMHDDLYDHVEVIKAIDLTSAQVGP